MTRPTVLISYSHKDEQEKEQLLSHLGVLQQAGLLDLWSDDRIAAGADWQAEAQQALAQARLAILLITANYLTTDFILDETIPTLLQRHKEEGSLIFPIIARACAWKNVPWLAQMEIRPKHSQPVWRDIGQHVDSELAAIADEVGLIVQGGSFEDISRLSAYEAQYRKRLKARFAEDAAYYIPLVGETVEVTQTQAVSSAPRAVRRRGIRPEYKEWIQAGQEIKRVRLDTLREGVDKYPCIILLGEPGSGKTTALENLAYQFTDDPKWLPIPLRLSEFGPGLSLEEFIVRGWGGSAQAGHWAAPELAANLQNYLEAGKLFFLFDALNEMPREGFKERASALRSFINLWLPQSNRFLVSCRVLDYGEELSGLQRIEVQPLDDNLIQIFLVKELPKDWGTLWQTLIRSKDKKRRLLELARNPYLLTMMIDIFVEDGQLGRNRAELMTRFTQIQMSWAKAKTLPKDWLEAEAQQESLAELAFQIQRRTSFGTLIPTEQVKTVMPITVQPNPQWPPVLAPAEQVLALAASANIIEMPVDRSTVRFYHQLLQEYFAARALLKRVAPPRLPSILPGKREGESFLREDLAELWGWPWLESELLPIGKRGDLDLLPPLPLTGWEETTLLAFGLSSENDEQLVRALAAINPVLAGRCLHEARPKVDKATWQAAIQALLQTIVRPEVALRVRIAAAEVMGYLGDPRIGEWSAIPAGEFVMGGDNLTGTENPQHKLYLPEYLIGRYLLTNAEFAGFIEDGGYHAPHWWTDTGWQEKVEHRWTKPAFWDDSRSNKPNQPVIGISWHEAVAYCSWRTAQFRRIVRLATEAEWEKAARGTDGRIFPWGRLFDPTRLNMRLGDQQVNRTTPVGVYPTGVSPFGLYDCAGNAWEWCAIAAPNYVPKPYPYQVENEWNKEHLNGTFARVLRGGSWFNFNENFAHCTFRFRFDPSIRDNWGCRLVTSSV